MCRYQVYFDKWFWSYECQKRWNIPQKPVKQFVHCKSKKFQLTVYEGDTHLFGIYVCPGVSGLSETKFTWIR